MTQERNGTGGGMSWNRTGGARWPSKRPPACCLFAASCTTTPPTTTPLSSLTWIMYLVDCTEIAKQSTTCAGVCGGMGVGRGIWTLIRAFGPHLGGGEACWQPWMACLPLLINAVCTVAWEHRLHHPA